MQGMMHGAGRDLVSLKTQMPSSHNIKRQGIVVVFQREVMHRQRREESEGNSEIK